MPISLSDRIPFAKIVTILAIVFVVSLGLCGLTYAASTGTSGDGGYVIALGLIELAAMALSLLGLIVTALVWLVKAILESLSPNNGNPQKLFDAVEVDPQKAPHDDDQRGDA
jgi:hypothetical protein